MGPRARAFAALAAAVLAAGCVRSSAGVGVGHVPPPPLSEEALLVILPANAARAAPAGAHSAGISVSTATAAVYTVTRELHLQAVSA
jgi:hypothetical protein